MPWLGPLLRVSHSCSQSVGWTVLSAARILSLVVLGLRASALLAVSGMHFQAPEADQFSAQFTAWLFPSSRPGGDSQSWLGVLCTFMVMSLQEGHPFATKCDFRQ